MIEGNKVKLLFWNLARNSNASIAKQAIQELDIDIAVFAEFENTDLYAVASDLGPRYVLCEGYGGCDKVRMISRCDYCITVVREATRYTIYYIQVGICQYIIAATHLPDPLYTDREDRKKVIRDLVQDIISAEAELQCDRTMIIGDLNASPFDEELVQKDCFNAVLFKDVIENQEYVQSNDTVYRRFYNPSIDYISEERKNYGSFYRSSGIKSLYWYSYDQIIMRKALIRSFIRMEYLKNVSDRQLLTEHGISKHISDHLPLFVEIKKEE